MPDFQLGLLQPSEIEELLALQHKNMKGELTPEVARAQGFLTFSYSHSLIQSMMADMPQPVAHAHGELIGYALATSREVGLSNELLAPAIELCDTLSLDGKPLLEHGYYMMGQICIAEKCRGLGIFDALYQSHKTLFSHRFPYLITEISIQNARSLAAHQRVGFRIIHNYSDGHTNWHIVAWDWK
ncbi:MAG: GNAT family N-acetyltransferase [Cytophagales bacterium]|nr:GNAT family N-acetyltransferase [Cytophagales bacterium]